jgi:hypothetical protein
MTWYAEAPDKRRAQMIIDALVALWVVLWLRVGLAVRDGVSRLAAPGRELEEAGDGLAGSLSRAAERADGVPLLGDGLRSPLDAAAGAGETLARAGSAQQDAVGTLALLLALVLAGLPLLLVLAPWLRDRLSWSREATAARALREDVDLLALRAATSAPLPALAALGPDPVGRWRRGEPGAAQQLAALELRRLGLRPQRPERPQRPDAQPPR